MVEHDFQIFYLFVFPFSMKQISISASRLQSKVFDSMNTAKATKLNVYDALGTALIDAGNDLGNNLPYGYLSLKDFMLEISKCVCALMVERDKL